MSANNTIIGKYYRIADQLRKVIDLIVDEEGRTRVIYLVKSAEIPNQPFGPQGTKANRKLLVNFETECPKALSEDTVKELRERGIILTNE